MVIKSHLLKQVYQDLESLDKPRSLVDFSKDVLSKESFLTSSQRKDLSTHYSRHIKDLDIKAYAKILQNFQVPLSTTTARLLREHVQWEEEEQEEESSDSVDSLPSSTSKRKVKLLPSTTESPSPSLTIEPLSRTNTYPTLLSAIPHSAPERSSKTMTIYPNKPPVYPLTPERRTSTQPERFGTPERLSHPSPNKSSPFRGTDGSEDGVVLDLGWIAPLSDGSITNPHIIFLSGDKQPQCKHGVKAVWADDAIIGPRACTVLTLQAKAELEEEDDWKLTASITGTKMRVYHCVVFSSFLLLLTFTSESIGL